jgi:hypothetical protein
MSKTVRWMRERIQNYRNINKTAVAEPKQATSIALTVAECATSIDVLQSEICQFFHKGQRGEPVLGKRIEFLDVLSMCMTASNHHLHSIYAGALQYTILPSEAGDIGGDHV